MNRDSYSDQQAHASFQPRSTQAAIDPTQLSQPVHHSSSTTDLGSNWLNKASGWVANKFQSAQDFVNGSGDAIAPNQILPALKGTASPNQPLVGVIDSGFGANEHGSKMAEAIQKENPQAQIWQGKGVGTGNWSESLVEFVDTAKAGGHSRAVANLSFDLTEVHPDGSTSNRSRLTADEQSALAYAHDNDVLVVASSGNQGGAMSALGQASQPSDNLIVVGAANGSDRASYSSYGNGLDLVAEVGSAGTSLAAAKVTGAIASIWSANPELSSQQVNQMLTTTATDLKAPGRDAETGAGLLNSTGAINLAKHTTPEAIVFSGAQLVQPVSESLGGATWESRDGSVASERTNFPIEGDGPRSPARSTPAQRAVAPRRRDPLTSPRPVPPTPAQRAAGQRAFALHRQGERTPLPPRPAQSTPTPAQRAAGQRAVALRQQGGRTPLPPRPPAPPTPAQHAFTLHRQGERAPLPPRPAQSTPTPAQRAAGQRAVGQRANELHRRGERTPLPPQPTAAQRDVALHPREERAPLNPPRPTPPVPDTNGYAVVSEVGHAVLDVVGLTPVGFLADGLNAVWYAAEGDYENAAVSALGVLPGGEFATGARLGRRASELANRASEVYGAVEETRGIVEGVSEVANGNFNSGDAAFTLAETVFSSRGRRDRPTGPSAGNDRNGELNVGVAGNPPPQNPPRNSGSPSRSGSELDARGRRDDRGRSEGNIRDRQPIVVGGRRGDQSRPSTAVATSSGTTRDRNSRREIVTVGARDRTRPSTDRSTAGNRDRQPVAVGGGNGRTRPSSPSTTGTTPGVTTHDRNSRADSAPAPRSGGSGNSNQPPRKPPTGGGGRPTGGYDDSDNNGLPAGNSGNSGNSRSSPNQPRRADSAPTPQSGGSGNPSPQTSPAGGGGFPSLSGSKPNDPNTNRPLGQPSNFDEIENSPYHPSNELESDAAERAKTARDGLEKTKKTLAKAEDNEEILSGWAKDPRRQHLVGQVESFMNKYEIEFQDSGAFDQGEGGKYKAAHAERMAFIEEWLRNPDEPVMAIGVNRALCKPGDGGKKGPAAASCEDFFQDAANVTGKSIVIADYDKDGKERTLFFRPE
ncbi:S8 family serine peptidase [Leptolyngbya sp. FACHB-321]|uniref:S8 family serine peptidase n=1 Tax=Leptolyngbya sp. FACHB-321 TaxID=2692807 RepID=UPI00168857CE|nr:S8 family serine peptidase [Leptolyngbya sp. FACHB-321]MBD2033763.1 S8 family serine peptidase [Leptolyngbya sp. FACHB-321]